MQSKVEFLESSAVRIDYLLSDSFNNTQRLMIYIGKQIMAGNYKDLSYIHSLLKSTSGTEYKTEKLFSWSLFDWVDSNNMQILNRVHGIAAKPVNMSHREYTWKCPNNPWTLQFSKPAIGHPSNTWVIPAGVGILGKNDEFIGTLVVGFNLGELTELISEKISGDNINVIVTDENLNIVLDTTNPRFHADTNLTASHLPIDKQIKTTNGSGILKPGFKRGKDKYVVYKKMHDMPYYVVIGYNHAACLKEFILIIMPNLLHIISLGLLSIFLVYFSRKKVLETGRTANRAEKELADSAHRRLTNNLEVIQQYSEALIKNHTGSLNVSIDKSKQLEFLTQIQQAARMARSLEGNVFDLTTIDLNSVLEDSLKMHSMTILQRNLSIDKKLYSAPLLMNGDLLNIKQVFALLVSLSVNYSLHGSKINITTAVCADLIEISIHYKGFDLSDEDVVRIMQNIDCNDVNLDYITKLVKLHSGSLQIKSRGILHNINLTFPALRRKLSVLKNTA